MREGRVRGVVGVAHVAAAVAVGLVAHGVVHGGEGGGLDERVGVLEDDVGAGGVRVEVEVVAVEHEGDGVVGVEGADGVVRDARAVEGVGPPVGLVARVVEQEGGVGL